MDILAQILGFLGLLCLLLSYQQLNKRKYLYIQGIASIFYCSQYLMLKAYSAVGSNIIAIIRSFLVYYIEKKTKKTPIIALIIIEIMIIIIGLFTYENIYSLIPIIIASLFTLAVSLKRLEYTYFIGVIAAALWILYNLIVGAYVAAIGSVFELISAFIGMIKIIKDKQNKTV